MSNQIRPYDALTSENAALVLIDHQVGLMTGVRDYSTGELKHNVIALAKAANSLKGMTDQVVMSSTPGFFSTVLMPRGSSKPEWLPFRK